MVLHGCSYPYQYTYTSVIVSLHSFRTINLKEIKRILSIFLASEFLPHFYFFPNQVQKRYHTKDEVK